MLSYLQFLVSEYTVSSHPNKPLCFNLKPNIPLTHPIVA